MISTKEYIKRWKREYKLLKPVYCQALCEKAYFTSEGFNHLIYKKGRKRTLKEIYSRLQLIKYIKEIVKDGKHIERIKIRHEFVYRREVITAYFAISKTIKEKSMKVVLRKRGNKGEWIFLSIMNNQESED